MHIIIIREIDIMSRHSTIIYLTYYWKYGYVSTAQNSILVKFLFVGGNNYDSDSDGMLQD